MIKWKKEELDKLVNEGLKSLEKREAFQDFHRMVFYACQDVLSTDQAMLVLSVDDSEKGVWKVSPVNADLPGGVVWTSLIPIFAKAPADVVIITTSRGSFFLTSADVDGKYYTTYFRA